ncbi:MAG TPA: ABC transporter permease, partial [Thermoleophilia bacterium]|nr:ABC transporter permease [Thermoleophilia bacterium]
MRNALFISLKDVRRAYRDPAGIAMMLLAPLVLTLLLGAAFGDEVGQSLTPVPVVLVDEDGGESARSLVGGLEAAGGEGLLELSRVDTREQAETVIDAGDASAAIIIPEGFSEAFSGGWSLGGAGIQVELLQDPAASAGPRLVAGVLRQLISSFNGAWAAGAAAAVEAGVPGLAAVPESDGGFPAEPGGDLAAARDAAEAAVHRFR